MDHSLEEGALKGVGVSRERWGLVQPGGNLIFWRRCFPGGRGLGGNDIWCLTIVVIFMGLGEAKRWSEVLKSSCRGGTPQRREGPFFMELTPLDTVCLQLRPKPFLYIFQ